MNGIIKLSDSSKELDFCYCVVKKKLKIVKHCEWEHWCTKGRKSKIHLLDS